MDNFHPSYMYENVLYVTNVLHLGNEILVLIKTVLEKGILCLDALLMCIYLLYVYDLYDQNTKIIGEENEGQCSCKQCTQHQFTLYKSRGNSLLHSVT